jgi:O-antigen/teichoic acid export membrane protein
VGRYNVAYLVGSIPLLLVTAVENAWIPLTFSAPDHSRWSQLSYTTTYVVGFFALAAGVLALIAPVAMVLVLPGHYRPSTLAPVIALVAFAVIPWTFFLVMGQVLLWNKATLPISWIVPAAAFCNVALAYGLYQSLKLPGVAAATPLALTVAAVLMARAARRYTAVPWDVRALAVLTAAALVLVGLGGILPSDSPGGDAARISLSLVLLGVTPLGWKLIKRRIGDLPHRLVEIPAGITTDRLRVDRSAANDPLASRRSSRR